MLSLLNKSNKLKEYIDNRNTKREKILKWTRIDANSAVNDFPVLTLEQLNDITLGCFQLKQAKKYTMEHLSKDGSFAVQLTKQRIDIVRAQMQSRYRENVTYNLYIQYTSTSIVAWYCQCRSGGRVIGRCSHIASVIWYLAFARHTPQQLIQRSDSYVEILDNARDCSDLFSDDSDDDDSQVLYSLL